MLIENYKPEIRYRNVHIYINDLASTNKKVPEAVFSFTLDEIYALEDWIPESDYFRKEVVKAREKLEELMVCPLCGKFSETGAVHKECADREQSLVDKKGERINGKES